MRACTILQLPRLRWSLASSFTSWRTSSWPRGTGHGQSSGSTPLGLILALFFALLSGMRLRGAGRGLHPGQNHQGAEWNDKPGRSRAEPGLRACLAWPCSWFLPLEIIFIISMDQPIPGRFQPHSLRTIGRSEGRQVEPRNLCPGHGGCHRLPDGHLVLSLGWAYPSPRTSGRDSATCG